ncbi:MAG: hypothetical protein HPY79_02730 [Bacteroidales bacterium]|nr:hypothetical protein [Bacteroidales bacterium]
MIKCWLVATLIFVFIQLQAQLTDKKYVNAKIGQGVLWGGRGIALEYRIKHLGFSLNAGYQSEQYIYEHTIQPSFNYGIYSRYYYYRKSGNWQAYTGIYFGWLNNYYLPSIGESKYNPIVYGFCGMIGVEIREEILNVDIGLTLDPGIFILDKKHHPEYETQWNISPNMGLGINLYALHSAIKFRKKMKRKSYKYTETSIKNDTLIKQPQKSIHELLIEQKALSLIEQCNQQVFVTNEKVFFQNDTLYLLKQVGIKQYVYIKHYLADSKKEQFYATNLASKSDVYLINHKINIESLDEIVTLLDDCDQVFPALNGLLSIYIVDHTCFARLEQLTFKDKQGTILFDSISFCKLTF